MTTQVLVRRMSEQLENLREEVSVLKGFFCGTFLDSEGEYRPEFVEKILASEKESAPYVFTTPAAFLKHINGRSRKNS